MNSVYMLLLLAAAAIAIDPHELWPCSFELMSLTTFYSGGSEITRSADAVYHDHDNLWRWDSDFDGIPGLFDDHVWSVIWRPDDGASYHDNNVNGTCLKNNGGKKMYPYPYDWVLSKTDGAEWSEEKCKYNGQDANKYTVVASSTKYHYTAVVNLFVLKTGEFVYGNGTVEGSLVDLTFTISVSKFVFRRPIVPGIFVPDPSRCPSTTTPANPSKDFEQFCYTKNPSPSSGAATFNPSILFLLASLLMTILIFVSM